jgi:hypothetical protein
MTENQYVRHCPDFEGFSLNPVIDKPRENEDLWPRFSIRTSDSRQHQEQFAAAAKFSGISSAAAALPMKCSAMRSCSPPPKRTPLVDSGGSGSNGKPSASGKSALRLWFRGRLLHKTRRVRRAGFVARPAAAPIPRSSNMLDESAADHQAPSPRPPIRAPPHVNFAL